MMKLPIVLFCCFSLLFACSSAGTVYMYDSYSFEDFFKVVATTGGWTYAQVSPFITTLRNNWYTTVANLRPLQDSQYSAMSIPVAVGQVIHTLSWKTKCDASICKHGGTPAADCNSCSGCLGGWTGTFCDKWNPTKTKEQMLAELKDISTKSIAHVQSLAKYKPIPNQIGLGVDITTGRIRLPVVQLTYNPDDNIHTYTDYKGNTFRLPQEAVFDPLPTGKYNPVMKNFALETIKDYVNTVYGWSTSKIGLCGFFANQGTMTDVFTRYFKNAMSLGLEQMQYPAYKFTLPPDPVKHARVYALDEYAQAAIDYLPPTYSDETSKALWKLFVQTWGTSYTVSSVNGGLVELVVGIKAELFSMKVNGQYLSPADIAHNINVDFLKGTGKDNGNSQLSEYLSRRSMGSFGCAGGDPNMCNLKALDPAWTDSVSFAPVPLTYEVADIGELIMDPGKKSAFQQAMQAAVKEQIEADANMDSCPVCVWGSCAKPAARCTCVNNHITGIACDTCIPGWAGDKCQSPTCGTGCVHGTCVSPDVCSCAAHWGGAHCEHCTAQWKGSDCKTPVCEPACAHGTCTAPNTCSCAAHYDGPTCSTCLHGWSGANCATGGRCYRCGGSGKVCHPSGCTFGTVTCSSCSGTGMIPSDAPRCYKCGGSGSVCHPSGCTFGTVTCNGCQGKGYLPAGASKCVKCYGSGSLCHPSGCDFGRVTCSTCQGKGWM